MVILFILLFMSNLIICYLIMEVATLELTIRLMREQQLNQKGKEE